MSRRTRIWQTVAVVFLLINAGGALAAEMEGEGLHAGVHVALLIVGAFFARRLWDRAPKAVEEPVPSTPLDDRLTNLEQSIDAVAIEIERIGEGQRFMTQALTEQPLKQRETRKPE